MRISLHDVKSIELEETKTTPISGSIVRELIIKTGYETVTIDLFSDYEEQLKINEVIS
jgi:hypothetical protein